MHVEERPREYTPETDPLMHAVAVQQEFVPGIKSENLGYKTDTRGAKVDLQGLAENIKTKRAAESTGCFGTVYFMTASGTIYQFSNTEDGAWEVGSSRSPRHYRIQEICTFEVGQRFQSPHHINGMPELDTSAVQVITLVDSSPFIGINWSQGLEKIDIALKFNQATQPRSKTPSI